MKVHRVAIAIALSVTVAHSLGAQSGSACRRPPAKPFHPGDSVLISGIVKAPCTVELHDLGVELKMDDKTVQNIEALSLVKDSHGRYYTSDGFGGITVWTPAGKFLQTIGREGGGPGEFHKGALVIALDPADNLYAYDFWQGWSVFSPQYKYLRTVRGEGVNTLFNAFSVAAPFTIVSLEDDPMHMFAGTAYDIRDTTRRAFFTVYDVTSGFGRALDKMGMTTGLPIVRKFGYLNSTELARKFEDRTREISPVVGGSFWVGPPRATGRGYELQLWNVDGTLLRTIKRTVPWFKPGSDLAPEFMPPPPGASSPDRLMGSSVETTVISARDNGDGLIFVAIRTRNKKWSPAIAQEKNSDDRMKMFNAAFDYYCEVIDARGQTVLASEGPFGSDKLSMIRPNRWTGIGWNAVFDEYDKSFDLIGFKMKQMRLITK